MEEAERRVSRGAASELPPGRVRHVATRDEKEGETGSWGRRTEWSPEAPGAIAPDRLAASFARLERLGKGSWWALGVFLAWSLSAWFLLRRFGSFIVPSVIGIVLATTLSPVVGWMERRRVPRLLGAVIIALVVVLLLMLLAWALVVIVVDQGPQIWQHAAGGRRADRPLAGRQRHGRATRWRGWRRWSAASGRARPTCCRWRSGGPRPVRARRGRVPRRRVQLLLPLGGSAGAPLDLAPPI